MLKMWLFWEKKAKKDPKESAMQSKNIKSQIKLYFSGPNKGWLHYHSEYHSYSMIQDDPNAANRI